MPGERRELRRRLFLLASEPGGHFTAAQVVELGYSYQAQAHHVAAGNWIRVGRGVFRLTEWVMGLYDDLCFWNLWSRGRAVVSHASALAVYSVGELEDRHLTLTVPPAFTMTHPSLALVHADLDEDDVEQHTGFRTTTVMRSLIDVALRADEDQLARTIMDARALGRFTLKQLRTRAELVDPLAALRIERALGLVGSA